VRAEQPSNSNDRGSALDPSSEPINIPRKVFSPSFLANSPSPRWGFSTKERKINPDILFVKRMGSVVAAVFAGRSFSFFPGADRKVPRR
jgi:hypothetical protein